MNELLAGKNILFLSPSFFNYEKRIAIKMEELGSKVRTYDERSVASALGRAFLKVNPGIFKIKSDKYYNRIIKENKRIEFDYILIIKCDMPSEGILKKFKLSFPNAKMCLYMWDSVDNIPGIKNKIKYFDYASSFDQDDCKAGLGLAFRPLFYTDEFVKKESDGSQDIYDVAFLGTIHSDRYRVLKEIEALVKKEGLRYYSFYYLQSKFIYYYYKLTKKSFRNTGMEDFSYGKKNHEQIVGLIEASKVIIDIQHPAQTGLTMRTFEMIGLQKKMITTNGDIVNYDFYRKENIYVIDRHKPVIDKEFLFTPYRRLPDEIYRKYTLKQWVFDVLGIGEGPE